MSKHTFAIVRCPGARRRHAAFLAVGLLAGAALADSLTLTGDPGVVTGSVLRLTENAVVLEGREPVAFSNVVRVAFAAPDLLPYPDGVILADGTMLGGVVKTWNTDRLLLRSVTLGEISLPASEVVAYYHGSAPDWAGIKAPPAGGWGIVLTNGMVREGSLVAVSPISIVVRAGKELIQIPMETVSCMFRSVTLAATAPVALRNRDRFGKPVWTAAGLAARIGNLDYPIRVEWLKDVRLKESR